MPNYVLDCVRGPNKSFWKGQLRCCLVTSLKIYQISADYSGRECTRTPRLFVAKMHKIQFISGGKENISTTWGESQSRKWRYTIFLKTPLIKCCRGLVESNGEAAMPLTPHLFLHNRQLQLGKKKIISLKDGRKFNLNQSELEHYPHLVCHSMAWMGLDWLLNEDRWGVWNLASSKGGKATPEISWQISCQNFNLWTWDTTNADPAV